MSSFLYRNEIKELTLNLEVLRQVDSFDEEMNISCHNDDRNEVLILPSLCVWPTSKSDRASYQVCLVLAKCLVIFCQYFMCVCTRVSLHV